MSQNRNSVLNNDGEIRIVKDVAVNPAFDPGVYECYYSNQSGFWFEKIENKSDKIIDIPSPEYRKVVRYIDAFFKPEVKSKFTELGFLYKRSFLLYGAPGTGKTVLVNRLINKVISENGIVLFNPDPRLIQMAYEQINKINPNLNVMVVFEELDELIKQHEKTLLNILDGEIQRDNMVYVATTNYIDRIPDRIKRPGRFSSKIEVKTPNAECRTFYLKTKFKSDESKIKAIVDKTNGFTIDELKEVVLATECLGENLDNVIKDILNNSDRLRVDESKAENNSYDIAFYADDRVIGQREE